MVRWACISNLLTTKAKVDRALMKERNFDKEILEVKILSWMPFKVSS